MDKIKIIMDKLKTILDKKKVIVIVAAVALLLLIVTVLCVCCTNAGDTNPTDPGATTTQPSGTDPTGTVTNPTGTETDPTGTETEPTREPGVYYITILPSANGTVVADRTEARDGDTVTLTVTPNEGYELLSLTVNGENSELTFAMPAEDVNVLARFGLPEGTPDNNKVYPNGDFFGSAEGYHSSDVLDMSTDSGKNPYLAMDSNKTTPLYAYVKGVTAKQFYLEMTVQVTGIRSDEAYPKFGLMTNDGGEMVKFYLDMNTDKLVSTVGAVHQVSGKEDDWAGQATWNLNKKLDLSAKTVKLGLLRDGKNYYFYANGQLVATGSDLSGNNAATGIFSFGTSLKLTDYKLVQSEKELNSLLNKAKADVTAFNGLALTENYFSKTSNGVYTLTTNSDAQYLVDDVTIAGQIMREKYYSLKGKLTLTNAKAWGQARILITADPQNEYVIALEKLEDNNYQIFTMSKVNEEGWNNWKLIDGGQLNGSRNSIDFEIIVIGNQMYFVIDNALYYTSSSVSMTESTVKFTGYNEGTTTVENLSMEVFANEAAAKTYADTKQGRFGENFGVSQDTYWTTSGVDLTKDNGSNPSIQLVGGVRQYAYLNGVFTDKFCFETEINVQSVLNSDAYPKFGIMVNGATQMVKFYVDMTPELTATNVGVVYQPTGGGDDWAGAEQCQVSGMSFAGSDTIKLKVVRDGRAYYFYVNDTLVLCEETGFAAENGAVGIFSFNTVLTASDYKISTGSAANSAIESAKDDAVDLNKLGLTCNWFADKGNGVYTLTTTSSAGNKVDDLTLGGRSMKEAYYSVKGKLTLTEAGDWGQARILISADAQNEYFIALERTDSGKFQIFTMSKKGSNDWGDWKEIVSADVNGSRNSIDFEVIVIGDKLSFLIGDTVVYTDSSVSMGESTVKFAGYNMGITTVENLSAQVFETQQDAESYLAGKK